MEAATHAAVHSIQDRLLTLEEEKRSLRESMVQQNCTISEQLWQQNEYLMLILANRPAHANQPAAVAPLAPQQEQDDESVHDNFPPDNDKAEEASPGAPAEAPPAEAPAKAPPVFPPR